MQIEKFDNVLESELEQQVLPESDIQLKSSERNQPKVKLKRRNALLTDTDKKHIMNFVDSLKSKV